MVSEPNLDVIAAAKQKAQGRKVLLSIEDLQVWFELRRFGFCHAGFLNAVDGVTFYI
jgi:peptide/nickel transport system ATP-binding protein